MRFIVKSLLCIVSMFLSISCIYAEMPPLAFESTLQEDQYQGLIAEFRCPKCQNQNLAGSDAPIAVDLKQRTYELVKQGQTDAQIRAYMVARYGDFISYKPPLRPSTWVLWFLPFILLIIAFLVWVLRTRQHKAHIVAPLSDIERKRLTQLLDAPSGASDTNPAPHISQEQHPS